MNKIEQVNDSKILALALVLMGIVLGLSVFSAGSADPFVPFPWI
jgi:hypothetical protein